MRQSSWSVAVRAATFGVVCVSLSAAVAAQLGLPTSKSGSQAKELLSLLQSKKLEAFAAPDPEHPGRFVAVYGIPGVQLLVVSAVYERPTDIEYRIFQKDYSGAYADLKSGTMSKERTFIEDMSGDGLQPMPPKNQLGDAVTVGADKRVFDGDFADPKKKNQKKISQEDYLKSYSTADETYTRLVGALLAQLKK